MTKPPKTLGKAGAALWAWLHENFDADTTEPLDMELCCTADRLAAVHSDGKSGKSVQSPETADLVSTPQ